MSHPAAELVGSALQKIKKVGATKKHPALANEVQQFLDHIDEIFSPFAAATSGKAGKAGSTRGSQPGTPQAPRPPSVAASENGSAAHPPAEAASTDSAAAAAPSQPSSPGKASLPGTPRTDGEAATYAAHLQAGMPLTPRTEMAISDSAATAVMKVFRLAVESNRAQIVEVVLDCIQKLIAFKFLQVGVALVCRPLVQALCLQPAVVLAACCRWMALCRPYLCLLLLCSWQHAAGQGMLVPPPSCASQVD